MTHQDWIDLFAPSLALILPSIAVGVTVFVTGLTGRMTEYFKAHGQAAAAQAVADAGTVINQALMTSATTIAGKIQTGQFDYTDRAVWQKEAEREVGLVKQRVPEMLAIAPPIAGALVANLMAKVDALVVASPSLPLPPPTKGPSA